MTAVERLRAAKALLVEKGWTRGHFKNGRGEMCAAGALRNSGGYEFGPFGSDFHQAMQALAKASGMDFSISGAISQVINWNDAPDTTEKEVLAAFDKAIELVEAA